MRRSSADCRPAACSARTDRFVQCWSHARKRPMNDDIAFASHDHALLRNNETIAGAAAPFAGGVAVAAAGNPVVVGRSVGNEKEKAGKDEREPCEASEHGYVPLVVPARPSIK